MLRVPAPPSSRRADSAPPSLRVPRVVRSVPPPPSDRSEDTPPTLRCNADGDGPVPESLPPLSVPDLAPAEDVTGCIITEADAPLVDGPLSLRAPTLPGLVRRRRRSGFDTLASPLPPPDPAITAALAPPSIRAQDARAIAAIPAAVAEAKLAPEPEPISPVPASAAPTSAVSALRHRDDDAPESEPPTMRPGPESAPRSTAPPTSRRDSMRPLRPITVPPERLPTVPPPRPSLSITPATIAEERNRRRLVVSAVLASMGTLIVLLVPALPPARSFRGVHLDAVLHNHVMQQASGFAILALSLAGLLLSARKRIARFKWGDVSGLRALHGVLGAATLVCLFAHTGLALGDRLNRLLMLDFLALTALGAVAAVLAAAPASGDPAAQSRRVVATRTHLVLFLPFPILVALHVLGAYYF
jgi:hypothetical protein